MATVEHASDGRKIKRFISTHTRR